MRYFFQFGLLAGVTMIAELLAEFLPFPIPASVYGLVIMFMLLVTKVVKLSWVEEAGSFFLSMMPVFFIAPGVSLMLLFPVIGDNLLGLLLASALSTIAVTAVAGWVAQLVTRRCKKECKEGLAEGIKEGLTQDIEECIEEGVKADEDDL